MNKTTVHNLLNELDDCNRYCIERAMDEGYGDEYENYSDGQQEYMDKHGEIRKLIGGQYGTNDQRPTYLNFDPFVGKVWVIIDGIYGNRKSTGGGSGIT